jgi:predicted Zn-dependent protease
MTLPDRSRHERRIAILVVGAIVILAIFTLWALGRGVFGWWSRRMATRELNIGAISAAQQWLARSAWAQPDDGRLELIQAACFRQLGQSNRLAQALDAAQRKGAPAAQVERELELGLIQSGTRYGGTADRLLLFIEAGVPTHDAAGAFVYGALAHNEPQAAREILDAWAADFPEDAHVAYMQGVYWAWRGERGQAQLEFEKALARQPRHERARTALAELLERSDQLAQALEQYAELTTRFPTSEIGQVGLARVLRKLGHVDQSRALLERLAARPETTPGGLVETGQLDLDSGDYQRAEGAFEQAGLDEAQLGDTLRAAATTLAFAGENTRAERTS